MAIQVINIVTKSRMTLEDLNSSLVAAQFLLMAPKGN
jgi:hypothetical protein